MAFAMSRAIMSAVTTFGIIYLVKYCGYWGICIVVFPMLIGYTIAFSYFQKLEEINNNPQKMKTDDIFYNKNQTPVY